VKGLRDLGVGALAMVTGDHPLVAERVAGALGLDAYRAECLPEKKAEYVRELRDEGRRVAVVGDGVNDAPALACGDTGIAMGAAGSDAAIHSATIALLNDDLRRIPFLLALSRQARRAVYQNVFIGTLFIVAGIALSGLGRLPPALAAFVHMAGSMIVVLNSARLVKTGDGERSDPPRGQAGL
jgi:Cd2+/Zn2+-exporting ATPase